VTKKIIFQKIILTVDVNLAANELEVTFNINDSTGLNVISVANMKTMKTELKLFIPDNVVHIGAQKRHILDQLMILFCHIVVIIKDNYIVVLEHHSPKDYKIIMCILSAKFIQNSKKKHDNFELHKLCKYLFICIFFGNCIFKFIFPLDKISTNKQASSMTDHLEFLIIFKIINQQKFLQNALSICIPMG
jgi:hypothetical protein